MSFASTPLGQSRRVADHSTFLGKEKARPASPQRPIPTSYSYGGPTTATKSPPKASSSGNTHHTTSDPALSRFARSKPTSQSADSVTSPHPEKWAVKGTSVQIAAAFQQAANQMNPNEQWVAGARPKPHVPRSTSVEYHESQRSLHGRLPAPPNRGGLPTRVAPRKPVSSSRIAEGNSVDDADAPSTSYQRERGKSPFEGVVNAAGRAAYYLKQNLGANTSHTNGNHSYDYAAEEREVNNADTSTSFSRRGHAPKRSRISVDNQAWKPTKSDDEQSEEESDDDRPKRRKKKKQGGPAGGPLTSLPNVQYSKRKKRPKKGRSEGVASFEGSGSEGEEEEEEQDEQEPIRAASRAPSRGGSVQPEHSTQDFSIDAEQGLKTIPEDDEIMVEPTPPPIRQEAAQKPTGVAKPRGPRPTRNGSVGALLGKLTRRVLRFFAWALHLVGMMIGGAVRLVRSPTALVTLASLSALLLWTYSSGFPSLPSLSSRRSPYMPSDTPIHGIQDLADHVRKLDKAVAGLSAQQERAIAQQENEAKVLSELSGRLSALDSRLLKELSRQLESENKSKQSTSNTVQGVKHDIEALNSALQRVQSEMKLVGDKANTVVSHVPDDEAREKLRLLEERVGTVEGGVKDAIEASKNAVKAGSGPFWNSGWKHKVSIKSADGQDVGSLINHLVESAVSLHGKDGLARPDFAMHSNGAGVIPGTTSPVLELRPKGITDRLFGVIRGDGYAVGRPPVVALHHEIHNGHCWPFAGSEGQLGVKLAAPVHIDEITIDHAARETVLHESDLRSAPRDMEMWGLVEGSENLDKLREWRADRDGRRLAAEERGEAISEDLLEPSYPRSLPSDAPYIRIAKFTYDVHAPHNIQTFPILPEIKDLHLDYGVVALRILNNWGRNEFTCLYRVRVHGERLGAAEGPGLPTYEEMGLES